MTISKRTLHISQTFWALSSPSPSPRSFTHPHYQQYFFRSFDCFPFDLFSFDFSARRFQYTPKQTRYMLWYMLSQKKKNRQNMYISSSSPRSKQVRMKDPFWYQCFVSNESGKSLNQKSELRSEQKITFFVCSLFIHQGFLHIIERNWSLACIY